ncbi:MAG: ribosome maturation factor RimM [Rhodospirillaceae bacterium]|nr:ribosome maturation factor RimM [Rhodospirillaceae bacterium]
MSERKMVCIGAVAGAHGVRGNVRIKPFTDAPEDVAAYGPVSDAGGARAFDLTLVGESGGTVIARLTGIEDRDAAEALRGLRLHVPRERLPAPEEDEFYHADLIGLRVVDSEGCAAGTVHALYDFGAGDLIEIRRPSRPPVLLPFTRAAVPEIDLSAGEVTVDAAHLAEADAAPAAADDL